MPENHRSAMAPEALRAEPAQADRSNSFHERRLRESLARAGATCGSLCGPDAPYEVSVFDPLDHTAECIVRGTASRVIRAPRRSSYAPELVAFCVLENRYEDVAGRLRWPDVVRRGSRNPARLVARAVAKANRMEVVSVRRGRFGGHLVKLRHSLSGPVPLPPLVMLTILVEGDKPLVLPPMPQPPSRRARTSDPEVAQCFRQLGKLFLANTGRKPIRKHIFAECRAETGATYAQMSRVWLSPSLAHLRRSSGEHG